MSVLKGWGYNNFVKRKRILLRKMEQCSQQGCYFEYSYLSRTAKLFILSLQNLI